MSEDPVEELERQIEDTREALGRTLLALRVELSPRHQLGLAWNFAKGRTARGVRAGNRWVRAHRTPALLAAVGVAGGLYLLAAKLRRRAR